MRAVKEAIEKDKSKAEKAEKRKKFEGEAEEIQFLRQQIECARTANTVFDEEMT